MTSLLRRARAMADAHGEARGKPVLIAVRVEDSVALSRDLGLDIERWLDEDLVDLVSASHYFRMVPWSALASLCAKHDVPFYPCLAESRVRDADGKSREPLRNSIECYRGRAMNAYRAGAAGIELYNLFNPEHPAFRELGEPNALATMDKIYFACVRGSGGAHWRVPNAHRYRRVPVLTPDHVLHEAWPLHAGRACVPLEVSDDLAAHAPSGLTLCLRLAHVADPAHVHTWLGGRELVGGRMTDGGLAFDLKPDDVKLGVNEVAVALWPGIETSPVLEDVYLRISYGKQ